MPRDDTVAEAGTDPRAPRAAQGAPRRFGTIPRAALLTPPEAPTDLRAALATTPAAWGRHMFDPASLDTRMATWKLTVKHPEDLLVLRQALFDDLCPSITWILRTSVLEWECLSAEQKQQQTEMREAWLSGYSKPSEAILQHWLWKFLKDRTRQFAHLHKVFTNIPSNTPQCGTAAWTQIFLHYPLAGAVLAHKLLARGLKACLKFKDDSSAAGCAYIESVNTSVSQLSNLPHLSVPDVFALVSLMGLYLSDAHGHQKAYKDLIAFIDEGNELTLDKVQNTVIYHSRDTSLRAFALTPAGASPSCNHRCPRCCDPRGTTPRPSRSSSRAGSSSGSPSATTHSLRGFVERMVDEKLAGPNPVYTKYDQDALTERENIWRAHCMPEETQAFAAMLYRNNVAPEQILFDAGCTDYADDRAHIAIAHAGEKLLREGYESTDDDGDA